MKKVALCLFTAFALVGCNKEKSTLKTSAKQSSVVAKTHTWESLCDVSNTSNEYDYIGSEHNRILDIYEASKESGMSLDEVYTLTDEILHSEFTIDPGYKTKEFVTPLIEKFKTEEELRKYINEQPTSELQKAELNNLITIMLEYDGTNLCETIDNIKGLENSLLSKYPSSDIGAVLNAAAVGRYSLAYWHEKVTTDPSVGGSMTLGWWKRFKQIALADAIGAGLGFLFTIGDPIGAAVGAVGLSIVAAT